MLAGLTLASLPKAHACYKRCNLLHYRGVGRSLPPPLPVACIVFTVSTLWGARRTSVIVQIILVHEEVDSREVVTPGVCVHDHPIHR
jgi:hypothetical protein